MGHHTDRGLLRKHKSDLHLVVHVSLHQSLKYDVTRIRVFLKIVDFSSGPDLNYTHSYTSILRLGLTMGDTPDTPYYHLETRGPSSTLHASTYNNEIGKSPEDLCSDRECFVEDSVTTSRFQPRYVFSYWRIQERYVFSYLNDKIPEDRGEYLARDTRCRRIFVRICSSPPPSFSIIPGVKKKHLPSTSARRPDVSSSRRESIEHNISERSSYHISTGYQIRTTNQFERDQLKTG
ncbi:hypothetical protein F511_06604 [Dorcoceras hygrometricum]|uniref:Uncharacterized protein n=1 Tax=Dorcoceras hygrometricum TaxID=472368 RepID=A0A2Z7BBD1_9LAMI|nr:hypothetical protein F511_06604 [Dorcoceras hygrometricum]